MIFPILFLMTSNTFAGSWTIERVARIRNFGGAAASAKDIQDSEIYSPKSVIFSADGLKFYVNSLEGEKTVVYGWPSLKKLKVIRHRFDAGNSDLFQGESTVFGYRNYQFDNGSANANKFAGKPVESALSLDGRYLWVTYYRRSYDRYAQSPSALAIIDTRNDEIIRVMPTGPIPKYVALSADGKMAAVIHWGDNTVGLIDTSSSDPRDYKYVAHLTVEKQLSQSGLAGTDRDRTCGFCLRGAVFSPDGRYLFVARMGGGGIAGFDVSSQQYLGSVMNVAPTPRHLALAAGEIIVSSNQSGVVSKAQLQDMVRTLEQAHGQRVFKGVRWQSRDLGTGARTLDVSPEGRFIFVAMNNDRSVVMVDRETLEPLAKAQADPYPVGLAVSLKDDFFIVTSQGHGGHGGNSVMIFRFHESGFNLP